MADGDLISRASLLAGIAELKKSPWYNFGKVDGTSPEEVEAIWHYGYLQRKEAVEIIEDICIKKEPAQPVKHGRWIWNPNAPHRDYGAYKCSNCGCHSDFENNYCHSCGVRMDGDSE